MSYRESQGVSMVRSARRLVFAAAICASIGVGAPTCTAIAGAATPTPESNCVIAGRECSADEIRKLCLPVWFGDRSVINPTIVEFCTKKTPSE